MRTFKTLEVCNFRWVFLIVELLELPKVLKITQTFEKLSRRTTLHETQFSNESDSNSLPSQVPQPRQPRSAAQNLWIVSVGELRSMHEPSAALPLILNLNHNLMSTEPQFHAAVLIKITTRQRHYVSCETDLGRTLSHEHSACWEANIRLWCEDGERRRANVWYKMKQFSSLCVDIIVRSFGEKHRRSSYDDHRRDNGY